MLYVCLSGNCLASRILTFIDLYGLSEHLKGALHQTRFHIINFGTMVYYIR